MKRAIQFLIMAAIMAASLGSAAQAGPDKWGAISGCLTDTETGLPIEGAWVAVLENNRGAVTDVRGCFLIDSLVPGQYTLSVTHHNYGTIEGLSSLRTGVKAEQTSELALGFSRQDAQEMKVKKPASEVTTADIEKIFRQSPGLVGTPWVSGGGREVRESDGASLSVDGYSSLGRTGKSKVQRANEPVWDRYQPQPHDMKFRDYGTNDFVDTRNDRFSTFAIDVDDASYSVAREYLRNGNLPPQGAIRVEEFVNHFDYGYNIANDDLFRVFTELTESPFRDGKHVMKIAVKGQEIDNWERQPFNVTLVIDKSGSMREGQRFELVRQAVRTLVEQLDGNDRVGIVAYGTEAFEVLNPTQATQQRQILSALERIQPGGSTFAEAGIRLGYEMANRQFVRGHNNIVILFSDGVANVGRTSPDAIMREIDQYARQGISLNSYGVGMGNYNDVLLEQLAQKGNGQYAYINDQNQVREQFGRRFMENMQVLARDVKVQVEFNPKLVRAYRLLGYENREVADQRFRDDRQDGGEVFAGHEITALYELVLVKQKSSGGQLADVFVRWKDSDETEVRELKRSVSLNRDFQAWDRARPEMRLAVVAGRFAEMLKDTEYATETSWSELARLAEQVRRELPNEQTEELLDLIRRVGNMDSWHAGYDDGLRNRNITDGNYKR